MTKKTILIVGIKFLSRARIISHQDLKVALVFIQTLMKILVISNPTNA